MRVISQDGTFDMPYEMSIIWCEDDGAVFLQPIGETGEYRNFATYSTEEKAKKAMEMLRVAYAGKFITNADIPDDFNETLKAAMKGGFGTVVVKDTCERVEFNNLNGYFHFPAEEELE